MEQNTTPINSTEWRCVVEGNYGGVFEKLDGSCIATSTWNIAKSGFDWVIHFKQQPKEASTKTMKIIVHPLLPTGNFLNCRIGVEKDYPDDYSLEQAINTEWDNLIAIHMKRYPHLYNEDGTAKYEMYKGEEEMKGTKVRDMPEVSVTDEIKATLAEINQCAELEGENGLKSYWLKSKGNLVLSEAYKTKEKQLTNAK